MAKAIAKFIRMSPRKLRRVINVIRGKDAHSAKTMLKFMPYAAADVVEKVLKSAVANATENEKLNADELRITKAYVDQSSTLRRWRAMSRGRGFPILKRTSHVTIEVTPDPNLVHKPKRTVKTTSHKVDHKQDHAHDHAHDHTHEHHDEHKHDVKTESKTKKPAQKLKEVKEKKEKTKEPKKGKSNKEKEE